MLCGTHGRRAINLAQAANPAHAAEAHGSGHDSWLRRAESLFCRSQALHALLSDGDTGWHIRTRETIPATGKIPARDIVSVSPGDSLLCMEVARDVILAGVCRGSSEAVAATAAAVIAAAAVLTLYERNQEVHKHALGPSLRNHGQPDLGGAGFRRLLPAGRDPAPSITRGSSERLTREWDRTNRILTPPLAMSGCARVRISP